MQRSLNDRGFDRVGLMQERFHDRSLIRLGTLETISFFSPVAGTGGLNVGVRSDRGMMSHRTRSTLHSVTYGMGVGSLNRGSSWSLRYDPADAVSRLRCALLYGLAYSVMRRVIRR